MIKRQTHSVKHIYFTLLFVFAFSLVLKSRISLDTSSHPLRYQMLYATLPTVANSKKTLQSHSSSNRYLEQFKAKQHSTKSLNSTNSVIQNDSAISSQNAFDFINGGWIGVNFMSHDYMDKQSFSYSVFSVNLDAGLGYYNIRNRGTFWHPDWTIYGGGLGLEFAYPISDQKMYLDTIFSTSYRYFLINLKGDFSKGFRALGTRFSGHVTAGLSTDIVSHYTRFGLGTGYQNFVMGLEYFASLTPNSQYNVFRFNWYIKYIIGRNRAL